MGRATHTANKKIGNGDKQILIGQKVLKKRQVEIISQLVSSLQSSRKMRLAKHLMWVVLFPTRLHVHQRMNANSTSTKWFIFLKQWYNEYNAIKSIFILHFLADMHADTYSVHNRFLKPWWGRLLCFLTSCHVFSPPLSELNWRSLTPAGGLGPPTPKVASLSAVSAHTPFPGSRTRIITSKAHYN